MTKLLHDRKPLCTCADELHHIRGQPNSIGLSPWSSPSPSRPGGGEVADFDNHLHGIPRSYRSRPFLFLHTTAARTTGIRSECVYPCYWHRARYYRRRNLGKHSAIRCQLNICPDPGFLGQYCLLEPASDSKDGHSLHLPLHLRPIFRPRDSHPEGSSRLSTEDLVPKPYILHLWTHRPVQAGPCGQHGLPDLPPSEGDQRCGRTQQ